MMTKLLWVLAAGISTMASVFAQTTGGIKAPLYQAMIKRSGVYELISERGNLKGSECPKVYEFFPTFQLVDAEKSEMQVDPVFSSELRCELTKEKPYERKSSRNLVFGTTNDGRAYMNTSCKKKIRGTFRSEAGLDSVWLGKVNYQEEVMFEQDVKLMTVTLMKDSWKIFRPKDYEVVGSFGVIYAEDNFKEQRVCVYRKKS